MSDFVNVFEDDSAPPAPVSSTSAPSNTGFVNVFDEPSTPQPTSNGSIGQFLANNLEETKKMLEGGLQTAFPVASTIADVYPTVEKATRPIVQAPVVGVGGLIDLAQGNSLQDAAAGIKAGKTAGDYLKEQIPDPETTSLWANIAGNLGKEAAGFVTDSGIYTGVTEGLVGNNVKPLVNVNLDTTLPPEAVELPRPFDVETTVEPTAPETASAPEAVKPSDTGFKNVFAEEAPKAPEVPTKADEFQNVFDQLKEIPDNPETFLKDVETPEEFKARMSQMMGINFEKALQDMDQGTHEPINLEEPLPRETENLSTKEEEAINSESGQVIGPGAIQEALAKKFDTAGAFSDTAAAKAERFGNIQLKNFEDEQAIRSIVDKLTPQEEQALALTQSGRIPRMWEGTDEGKAVKALLEKPTPALAEAQTKLQAFTDKALEEMKPIFPEMGALKKYFPDAWDFDKAPAKLKGGFSTDNPYTHVRTIPDRAQGMDMGLTPKYEKPGDALRAYARFKNESIENNVLLDKLTEIKTPEGSPMRKSLLDTKTGKTYANPDIPMSYVDGGKISPLWNGYKFPPEMAKELQFMAPIKELPLENKIALLNSTLKKSALSMSFFHHITLTESGIAAMGPIKTLKAMAEVPAALRAGGAPHLMPELSKDALAHNLTLGGVADVQEGLIKSIGEQLDKAISAASVTLSGKKFDSTIMAKALKPLGKLEEYWDKALWSGYHPILKLHAYENLVSSALRDFPKENPDLLKRQVADFVNGAFGGQAWSLVFNDPEVKRWLQHGLLALDWTASNIRTAEAFFEPGVKGAAARKYWMNMILLLAASTELLNGINKKAQTGKWDWSWNNDKDHKWDVWLYKDSNGMNKYVTLNKGAMEPFRWLHNPLKELAGKLSPALQIAIEQVTGHSSTGYDLDFAKPGNRVKALVSKAAPFSMGDGSFAGAWPVSQGISFTKFKTEMETAIYNKDAAKIQELMNSGRNNGLPVSKLYNQIRNQIKGKEEYQKRKDAEPGPTAKLTKKITGTTLGELAQSEFDKIKSKFPKKGK